MSRQIEKMMEIDEWLAHFKLNSNLEDYLFEFGVEVIEDLETLFKDENLLQRCKAGMAPDDFRRFDEAYQNYMSSVGDETVCVKSESWAEVSSQGSSSCSSPKRKFQSMHLNSPLTRTSAEREHDAKEDKRCRRITALDKKLTKIATMDLLIMLDCTGSMDLYIHAAKTRIRSLVKTISETYPDIPLRIAFIGYRDICDGVNHLESLSFQKNVSAFEAKLDGIRSFGGGSPLTDLTSALQVAACLEWTSAIRMLFHIGDYPCHGSEYHDGLHDAYPAGDPHGKQPQMFVKALAEMKVKYCFGQLTHYTDKMIRRFNDHVGHEYIKSSPMCSATMMEVITSSVTALLTSSLSSSSSTDSSNTNPRECELVQEMPAFWSAVRTERAIVFSLIKPASVFSLCLEENSKVVDDFPDGTTAYIKCAQHPFGRGRSKLAYYAQATEGLAASARPLSDRPMRVLKTSVYCSKSYTSKEKFEEYLASQRAALHLAAAYTKVRPADSPDIEFVATRLLQFLARPDRPYFIEETYIPGTWERFNNNTGYCAPFPTACGTNHHAVQAFSHWTHHVSSGRLMITDCQGSFDAARNTFVLTDPAVHCVSLLAYGGTNMGAKGFDRFFQTHRCNEVCRALGLIPHAVAVRK